MAQIFISYKRTDRDKVFPLVKSIENELGCKCWVDLDGIESSMQFASVICRAIDNAEVVLFMHSAVHLSIDYENDWTVKELNYAQQKSKRVVLVRLDGTPLDNIFLMNYGSKNNIDSRDPLQFEKLLNDLRSWLQLPQHKSTLQPEVMCPCGSGKPFKDCHGKTNPLDLPTELQADESPNEPEIVSEDEPVEAPVEAPIKTPADEPEEVPVVAPAYTPRSRNWNVGDYYNADGKEGVVFWVDQTGRYIKIVHLDHAKLAWCEYDERKVVTGAVDQYDGMKNLEVISRIPYWQSKYPAFAWCAERGAGWYLPAVEEFRKIEGLEKVNHTLRQKGGKIIDPGIFSKWLWSSTESEKDESVKEIIGNFAVYDSCKFTNAYVRAVAMIDTAQESSTIWKVGDYYNVHGMEGIVFQVDETGKHGKIVSLDEGYCRWSTVKQLRKGTATGATDKHDGMKNQQMIMEISDWHSKYPAFAWCAEHGPDWYLPAVEELKDLLLNREVYRMVDKTLSRMKYKKINSGSHAPWTWSSTEFNDRRACYISTIAKGIENTITELKCYVRAVSTF